MKAFVSSYAAAAPAGEPWDSNAEAALFEGLAGLDLAGLELPYYSGERFHSRDERWLLEQIRPEWRLLLTGLPGTMERLKADASFGLASADEHGRRRALDFAEKTRQAAARLNDSLGRAAVAAVVLHSAPRLTGAARSSKEHLAESLGELRRRDWGGTELLLEHCDAPAAGRLPEKGFMALEDELVAVTLSSGATRTRILINWGRSAIETRSAEGPLRHLRAARRSGLLAGLFFSGATPEHPDYGAWKDSHAPFRSSCPASLLTPEAAKAAIQEAGELDYLGLKLQPLPISLGSGERLAMLTDALRSFRD